PPLSPPLFPYTTLFRSDHGLAEVDHPIHDAPRERGGDARPGQIEARLLELHPGVAPAHLEIVELLEAQVALLVELLAALDLAPGDRKSTRLNSSHEWIS